MILKSPVWENRTPESVRGRRGNPPFYLDADEFRVGGCLRRDEIAGRPRRPKRTTWLDNRGDLEDLRRTIRTKKEDLRNDHGRTIWTIKRTIWTTGLDDQYLQKDDLDDERGR